MEQLPRVASNVYLECNKCERGGSYCRVITHLSDTTAQLECEICHKKRRFNLSTKSSSTSAKKKKKTSSRRKSSHADEYQALVESHGASPKPYSMQTGYQENAAINHPKFGLGIVKESFSSKISVVFEDQVRDLIHNKS